MKLENFNCITLNKASAFAKKGITSTEELIRVFPKNYVPLIPGEIKGPKEYSVIKVVVGSVKEMDKLDGIKATCTWGDIRINVMWFRQKYLFDKIFSLKRQEVLLCGNIRYDSIYGYSCIAPLLFEKAKYVTDKYYCQYKFSGTSDEYMQNIAGDILNRGDIKEYIDEDILVSRGLQKIEDALYNIHFPTNKALTTEAGKRIIYDDLLFFAGKNKIACELAIKKSPYSVTKTELMEKAIEVFKYPLTNDQKNTIYSIIEKMKNGERVNGLIQGDVGCGKTIVAFLVAICLAENGCQTAIMAPNRVVAKQHYEDIKELIDKLGEDIKCGLLISKMKKKETTTVKEGLKSGEIQIVVGTSSLLNEDIEYNKFACAIIDEEHKFGVIQRDTLAQKGKEGVHSISMSATPIPRTLAKTVYDDTMELYNINELPAGRKRTLNCITDDWEKTFKFCNKKISEGRQIFIVCPMIDKDDKGIASTEEIAEIYSKALPNAKISTLTGKSKSKEAEETLESFKNHEYDILVATSVVEVGVNIPNATSIIIHNAERFGLAALHQLRGRVGRSAEQCFCVFFSDDKYNKRLQVISKTNDGFVIAREDLAQRQTGDSLSTRQSGKNKYIDLVLAFPDIFELAKQDADILYKRGVLEKTLKEMEKFNKNEAI